MTSSTIVILTAVLFSTFFSGMEIAFVSANKLRLELDKKQNLFFSNLISIFSGNPGQFMATTLIGNYLAMIVFCIAFFRASGPHLVVYFPSEILRILVQAILSTLVILVTAEYLPRLLFKINPNKTLKVFALPIAFFYFLFAPATKLTTWFSKVAVKLFLHEKVSTSDEKTVFTRIDLDHFVNEPENSPAQSASEVNEVKLFRNALDFSKVRIREIMVPRTEMVALDIDASIDDLHQKFVETGYSRILFYSGNIDNIIGYVHHSAIFTNPDSIRSNLKNVLIVPETMPASKLLRQFIQQRRSIAIVVDEFGGTSGMLTSEDILEEIFGEIEDEHDKSDLISRQVKPNEYVLSGRLEIESLNEQYNLGLPEEEDFETLAGFILFHFQSIPKVNTLVTIGQYQFKILKATNTKVELVHLRLLDENQNKN